MADIKITLLNTRNSVAQANNLQLELNQNEFYIVAGEVNATTFEIVYDEAYFSSYEFYTEMVNSQGYGVPRTKIENKQFTLPSGMAVAGYGYISITAEKIGSDERIVFLPVKIKVQNTIPDWKENISKATNVWIDNDGFLMLETDDGNGKTSVHTLGYVRTTIKDITIEYGTSDSVGTKPTDWTLIPPTPEQGQWLWTRTTTQYTDGAPIIEYTYAYQGQDGLQGPQGIKGDPGPKGDTGDQGSAGLSVFYSAQDLTTYSTGRGAYSIPVDVIDKAGHPELRAGEFVIDKGCNLFQFVSGEGAVTVGRIIAELKQSLMGSNIFRTDAPYNSVTTGYTVDMFSNLNGRTPQVGDMVIYPIMDENFDRTYYLTNITEFDGEYYKIDDTNWLVKITGDVGPIGPKGDRGEQGEQGVQGEKGDTGDNAYVYSGIIKGDGKPGGSGVGFTSADFGVEGEMPKGAIVSYIYQDINNNDVYYVLGKVVEPIYNVPPYRFNTLADYSKGYVKISGAKGNTGEQGPVGVTPDIVMDATVDETTDTPAVNIVKGGTAEQPTFTLNFSGLKGKQGEQGLPALTTTGAWRTLHTPPAKNAYEMFMPDALSRVPVEGDYLIYINQLVDYSDAYLIVAKYYDKITASGNETTLYRFTILDYLSIKGPKGDTGPTPDIDISASVNSTSGTPSVSVTKGGTPEKPTYALNFSGLKGDTGPQGATGATPSISIKPKLLLLVDPTQRREFTLKQSGTDAAPIYELDLRLEYYNTIYAMIDITNNTTTVGYGTDFPSYATIFGQTTIYINFLSKYFTANDFRGGNIIDLVTALMFDYGTHKTSSSGLKTGSLYIKMPASGHIRRDELTFKTSSYTDKVEAIDTWIDHISISASYEGQYITDNLSYRIEVSLGQTVQGSSAVPLKSLVIMHSPDSDSLEDTFSSYACEFYPN